MSTISTHLRNFKEPTKDQLTELYFALPQSVNGGVNATGGPSGAAGNANGEKEKGAGPPEPELEKMEINAVLSLGVQGEEDSYVSRSLRRSDPSSISFHPLCSFVGDVKRAPNVGIAAPTTCADGMTVFDHCSVSLDE